MDNRGTHGVLSTIGYKEHNYALDDYAIERLIFIARKQYGWTEEVSWQWIVEHALYCHGGTVADALVDLVYNGQ